MLDDVVHPTLDHRGLGPERLPIGEPVRHETVVEADVDAIGLIERREEPHMFGRIARAGGRQRRRPANGTRLGIERAQPHQRMHDDDLWPGLEHFQCGRCRGHAHKALHQSAEAAALRFGLLEERFAHPALIAGLEVVQRHDRRTRGALAVHQQRTRLRQHAPRHDSRQTQEPRVEQRRARDRIENDRQSWLRRFHEERALHHMDAVDREAAQLRFLPGDLTALDVDAGEGPVARDQEGARGGDLLPPNFAVEVKRPGRDRAGRLSGQRGWVSSLEQREEQQSHG